MSYHQPGSTSGDSSNNHHSMQQQQQQHPQRPHLNAGQPSSSSISQKSNSNPRQTPLDWSNFMSLQTSPPGPTINDQPGEGNAGRDQQQGQRRGGGASHENNPDNYQAFAQGIAMNRPHSSTLDFAPPPPQHRSNSTLQHPHPHPVRQPSPMQMQYPTREEPNRTSTSSSTSTSNKGKSPITASNQSQQQQNPNDPSNGLSLDPSAFSREIRFQVPQFLSNNIGGAPTFPPGGEAWSGFSPANLFDAGAGVGHQLTPGSLFGTNFGSNPPDGGYNEQSGGGRNVLEGLSGFMNDGSWENWASGSEMKDSPSNFGTTFYVNPNPSPSILGPKHEQHQQQHDPSRGGMSQLTVNTVQVPPQGKQGNMGRTGPGPLSTVSPRSATTGTMPTSAIFSQQDNIRPPASFDIPSISTPTSRNISSADNNIASSSSQPYAPPQSSALLQGPSLPPNMLGTSLTDGPGLYSTTGFDMVGILAKVANRKDPKTQLGPVDFSCSFIVVDIRRYDSPIVYASPTFSALTGYELPQIVGRNCRFLQSPDGEVVKGSKRKYTDNVAVAHFKRMLNAGKECQASLINYRRGGMPFINLVTVIPIPWEGTDIVYHVGFQVDLVEQPNAILRNMRDGSYQVNYTVTNIPQAPVRPPPRDLGGVGLSPEILEILGAKINQPGFAQGEDGGKMEWLKMILENADDFVHVLSLKGMFQYVSPSVRRVLEYEPEDLINKNMSDICHPSDIVPLMRELKDSTHAPTDGNSARMVNLVFRVRRKSSGYVWIECTGRLHVEPGKGRKAVILTGRARSVPTLPWETVSRHGGLADREFWTKVSFDGLILHSTTTVNDVLGKKVDDIVGRSIYTLLPGGQEPDGSAIDPNSYTGSLASAMQQAAHGDVISGGISLHHKMLHSSGGLVDVQMIFYLSRQATDGGSRMESPYSELSRPTSSSSSSIAGVKPSTLVVQIKALPTPTPRQIVHPPTANVFEELETTRGTSWQYELHQLRLLNRRLKEDIASIKARGRSGNRGKKRKNSGDSGGAFGSSMKMTTLPEQYSAAPKHQLTPGFGLVAPGMPSPYYR